jgi:hypothetical protein
MWETCLPTRLMALSRRVISLRCWEEMESPRRSMRPRRCTSSTMVEMSAWRVPMSRVRSTQSGTRVGSPGVMATLSGGKSGMPG